MRDKFKRFAKTGAVALASVAVVASLGACSGTSGSDSAASAGSASATSAASSTAGSTEFVNKSAEELSSETVADGDWLRAIDWNNVQESDKACSLMGVADAPVTAKNLTKLVASTSVHVNGKSSASTSPTIQQLLKSKTKFDSNPNNAIKLYMNPVKKDAYGVTSSMLFDVYPTYDKGSKTFAQMVKDGSYYMVAEYARADTAFNVGNDATTDVDSMNAMVETYGRPAYIADIEGGQGNYHCILWQRDGYLFGCMYNEIAVSSDNLRVERVVYIPQSSWETVKQDLADTAQYTWYDFDEYLQNLQG